MTEDASVGGGASALFGKTMNCDEAVHQLYHFLDGEFTEERRAQIAEHLTLLRALRRRGRVRGGIAAGHRQPLQGPRAREPDSTDRRAAIDEESRQHDGGH